VDTRDGRSPPASIRGAAERPSQRWLTVMATYRNCNRYPHGLLPFSRELAETPVAPTPQLAQLDVKLRNKAVSEKPVTLRSSASSGAVTVICGQGCAPTVFALLWKCASGTPGPARAVRCGWNPHRSGVREAKPMIRGRNWNRSSEFRRCRQRTRSPQSCLHADLGYCLGRRAVAAFAGGHSRQERRGKMNAT